ncbi:MAG: hypothetical protein AVDCRST_MAG25-3268 [uncultured Rubrobacteraceae bacterium]|uniref:Uncharacterized protein n=1 Tax=uncultured Rubrobacteraceae bacterium TaxID=349277 RepID=A0A6J4SDZ6_9ACTN|nr:MAG: hypothetical protein AVDCRST_MAG25-3268 [uncultured Rubrobacteraceae bacterium]
MGAKTGNERRLMKTRKFWAVLAVLVLAFALAGCSDGTGIDDEQGIGSEDALASGLDEGSDGGGRDGESRLEEGGPDDSGEVRIGGFTVQGPDDEEISIPEAELDAEDVEEYAGLVGPTLDESTQDFSSLVDTEAGLQGETTNLSLSAESVEEALETNQGALEELQNLDMAGGVGDIHDGLVDSRQRAVSAYNDINQAFVNDESSDEVAEAVEENLPEIEYANAETRAILQELERAGSGQER